MKGLLQRLRTPEAFDRITRRWNQLQLLPIISILILFVGGRVRQNCPWDPPQFLSGDYGPFKYDSGERWWRPTLWVMAPYFPLTVVLVLQSFMARQPKLVQRAILNLLFVVPVCIWVAGFFWTQADHPFLCGFILIAVAKMLAFATPVLGPLLLINYLYTRFARFEPVDA